MSENTEALAEIIRREHARAIFRQRPEDCWDAAADAVLAAGYRKPRTITTVEGLKALPEMTAIIGASHHPKQMPGSPYKKVNDGEWWDYANDYCVTSDDIMLPATITFEPVGS